MKAYVAHPSGHGELFDVDPQGSVADVRDNGVAQLFGCCGSQHVVVKADSPSYGCVLVGTGLQFRIVYLFVAEEAFQSSLVNPTGDADQF